MEGKQLEERKEEFSTELESLGFKTQKVNNIVIITGTIEKDFEYSHQVRGEKFYQSKIAAKRASKTVDYIPVVVAERVIDVEKIKKGRYVEILGEFRSYNRHDGDSHLELFIFPKIIRMQENSVRSIDINRIYLNGFLCKSTVFRKTPKGSKITDFHLAVNRNFYKSDYIPSISWNKIAREMKELEIGDNIEILGRVQSREYFKRFSEDSEEGELRIAYEVSAMNYHKIK